MQNCNMQFVQKTKNKFFVRWTAHRSNWNKFTFEKAMTELSKTLC